MKKNVIVLISLSVSLFTGCMAINLLTVPQMTIPQVMMGNEGMYCYYYFDKFSKVNSLAKKMAIGASEPYRLAVEGYLPDKCAEAILAAVEMNKGKRLTYLRITYIGSEQYKDMVKDAVESIGAKFYFYERNK